MAVMMWGFCLKFGTMLEDTRAIHSTRCARCRRDRCDPVAGITKLDDANDAGGRNSHQCTLILTEGDSAKALAVSGLSVVGRNHYGVFPLRCGVGVGTAQPALATPACEVCCG